MVCIPPSAVCTRDTASWEFLLAWLRPRTWDLIFSEIARPAASSAARLTRKPELSLSMFLPMFPELMPYCLWLLIAVMLLLIRMMFASFLSAPGVSLPLSRFFCFCLLFSLTPSRGALPKAGVDDKKLREGFCFCN